MKNILWKIRQDAWNSAYWNVYDKYNKDQSEMTDEEQQEFFEEYEDEFFELMELAYEEIIQIYYKLTDLQMRLFRKEIDKQIPDDSEWTDEDQEDNVYNVIMEVLGESKSEGD
jgi:hypothetical protein